MRSNLATAVDVLSDVACCYETADRITPRDCVAFTMLTMQGSDIEESWERDCSLAMHKFAMFGWSFFHALGGLNVDWSVAAARLLDKIKPGMPRKERARPQEPAAEPTPASTQLAPVAPVEVPVQPPKALPSDVPSIYRLRDRHYHLRIGYSDFHKHACVHVEYEERPPVISPTLDIHALVAFANYASANRIQNIRDEGELNETYLVEFPGEGVANFTRTALQNRLQTL